MALIGIALCGFLLLALVSTKAGRTILKAFAGIAAIVIVIAAAAVFFKERDMAREHQAAATETAAYCAQTAPGSADRVLCAIRANAVMAQECAAPLPPDADEAARNRKALCGLLR